MKKNRFSLIYICILSILLGNNACSPNNDNLSTPVSTVAGSETPTAFSTTTPTLTPQIILQRPEGRFLFVEIWLKIEGTGKVPGARIDKPTYFFNEQSKVLTVEFDKTEPFLSPSDWGVLGQGISLHGTAGGGIACGATIIQMFPLYQNVSVPTGKINDRGTAEYVLVPVSFSSVLSDGTLLLEINGESITLRPGEAWSLTKEISFSSDRFNGQVKAVSSITNYGWLSIESINP